MGTQGASAFRKSADTIAPNPKPRLRVGIYCRISLDKQGDELGVQRQLDEARAIASARGWTVVAEYIDNSKSAFLKDVRRPEYEKMVEDAKNGLIDGIIVWDLDRLTRQPRQIEDWCDMGEQRGFVLVTVDGSHDLSTETGRMFARIKASVARQESEHKAKRQRAANDQRAKMGMPPHTGRAFGYNLDGTVREDEARYVREVFVRFNAGAGLHTIARWLRSEGVRNTRGKPFERFDVRYMLLNPRYLAQRWMLRPQPNGRRRREYVGPGNWTPLVTEEIFHAVGAVLNDSSRKDKFTRRGNAKLYFGSGTFRCGECSMLLRTGYSGQKDGSHYRNYTCPSWHVVRRADHIEAVVHGAIQERLRDPKIVSALAGEKSAESDLRALRDEANALRAKLDQITFDYAENVITARQLQIATEVTETKLESVEAELARLGSSSAISQLMTAVDPAAEWMMLDDVAAQAAIIDALGTVYVRRNPNGSRRPSPKNVEKHERWLMMLRNTVSIEWHGEDLEDG